ncbi:HTH-type transcriptional regulator [Arthrobacter ulcerisalmonis]|uniref:HTH-type transcriptional regulator n=2 Tax=Arthrobacter ulcerisalmonis TaxID=2483813 RepID=A0A3P5WY16_9MICC|nr:HTH-type transcriptional regulator [Arthrobacter ulcerisalmonis]
MSDAELDRLFQALADSTRRDIVRRVSLAEYSVSGLAALYAMSFAAVQKHVAVLERASLVTKEKRGREQLVRGNRDALQKAQQLLDEYEQAWRQRADRMALILAED